LLRVNSAASFQLLAPSRSTLAGLDIASLLLIASATTVAGVEDVALGLALLAAFASIAFVNSAGSDGPEPLEGEDG